MVWQLAEVATIRGVLLNSAYLGACRNSAHAYFLAFLQNLGSHCERMEHV